jgi:hypothetical protein
MNARDLWVRSAELLGVDEPLAEAADGDDLTDDETVTVADDPHSAPRVESDE